MATVREFLTKWGFKVDRTQLDQLENQMGRIRSLAGAATKILAGTGLATAGLLKLAGDLETNTVAFTTMLQSAEKAQILLRDLSLFAARTPFTIRDVRQNAKMLLGMGIEADKLIPTMKALGDVASGTGGNFRRIALNFGQVRTQARLTGRELVDFGVQGVPIIQELAKNFKTSEKAIKQMVTDSLISFDDVEKAFISMSSEGGKFNNLMIEQSKTLPGLLSNSLDILTILAETIGMELLPKAKAMVKEFFGWVHANQAFIKADITPFLQDMLQVTVDLFNIFKATFTVAKALAAPLGGLGHLVKILTVSMLAFAAAQMVAFGSSLITMGIGRITALMLNLNALYVAGGIKALAMWAWAAAGPLLAAASIVFLVLAMEDFVSWLTGNKKSWIGFWLGPFEEFKGGGLITAVRGMIIELKEILGGEIQGNLWTQQLNNLNPFVSLLRTTLSLLEEIFAFFEDEGNSVVRAAIAGDVGKVQTLLNINPKTQDPSSMTQRMLKHRESMKGRVGQPSIMDGIQDFMSMATNGAIPKSVRSQIVLPEDQVGGVASSVPGGKASTVNTNQQITINVDGSGNPQDTASAIDQKLKETYRESFNQNRNQVAE